RSNVSADPQGPGGLSQRARGRVVRCGRAEAQRYRFGHFVPDPAPTRIRRLVRQSLGGRRSCQRRPAAPPPLPSDSHWSDTGKRSVRKLRPRSSSMNGRNVIDTHGPGGWGNEVAQRLIHHAARNAPPPLAERLEEEWLADLAARRGQVTRVLFALGCCWATNVIAREHCALNVSAATAATGSTTMTTQVLPNLTFLPRRTTVLIAIVGLHVAIIYAFATGLAHRLIEPLQGPMTVDFLRDPKPLQTPQPLPNINLYRAPQIDLGQAPLIDTGERGPATITLPVPPVVAPLPPQRPTPPPVKRVSGGPGKGFPATEDYYPADSIRLGEQGSA